MYEPLNRKNKTMTKTYKYGRNSKSNSKTHRVMVRFDDVKCTIDLVKLSQEIVVLSREMYTQWEQSKQG